MNQSPLAQMRHMGQDGQPCRLGIMGGTFDPIHIGHLICAEVARETCNLDGVLFIPAGNPSFKQDRDLAPAYIRLAMCRAACKSNPYFEVSNLEIARDGITYAVDTMKYLRDYFPDNVEFYFITGADAIVTLPRWKDSNLLAELTHFICVSRVGYQVDLATKDMLEQAGFSIDYLEALVPEVASSDIRQAITQGRSVRYWVPSDVYAFIQAKHLYSASAHKDERAEHTLETQAHFCESVDDVDVLSDAFFNQRKEDLQVRVTPKRLRHIEGVAKAAGMLAQTYGIDERKARLAGLLHDWDKGYNDEEIRARVIELNLQDKLDPWVVEHMPQVLHANTAAVALKREFPQIPDDIIQAIDRHTTAAVDMTDLDMIVYVADAIEESRQYGRIDELRELVGKTSLENLFVYTYEYWVLLLIERGRPVHPDTMKVWNTYMLHRGR